MTSTDDISTESQFQLVPAYGSSSDDNNSDTESSGTASYEDLIGNPDLFWDKLRDFLGDSDRIVKMPTVGGDSLDLYKLFVEVTTRGGIEKVIKERKCKEVIGTFNFKKAMTNAAYVLRKNYLKTLFKFEHVFFFQEPLSSFWAREEAVKRLADKSANHDKGAQEVQRGGTIEGVIVGKFDEGYFVTMKMGSEELKGVLYHTHPPSVETPRRRKKKARLSQVDSDRPKFHRSGYNFFFSEQYRRLKPEYAGQERFLIKEIGNLWRNLSPSDRKVYQEKGVEDVERYNAEMAAYKSCVDPCAAEREAATDDAAATAAAAAAEAGL